MTTPSNALPNDIETLKRWVGIRDEMIVKLMAEIARMKRWQYGRSSERSDNTLAQMQLRLDDLIGQLTAPPEPAPNVPTAPVADSTSKPNLHSVKGTRRVPRSFPEHLPREMVTHAPDMCDCPDCGGKLRTFGEDVSEMLEMVPSYFKVIRHVRPKLACVACSRVRAKVKSCVCGLIDQAASSC